MTPCNYGELLANSVAIIPPKDKTLAKNQSTPYSLDLSRRIFIDTTTSLPLTRAIQSYIVCLEQVLEAGRLNGLSGPFVCRSMASTLLHEAGFDHAIIELQLSHSRKDRIAAAYDRSQRLPERRKMMQWYADYLDSLKNETKISLKI